MSEFEIVDEVPETVLRGYWKRIAEAAHENHGKCLLVTTECRSHPANVMSRYRQHGFSIHCKKAERPGAWYIWTVRDESAEK